MFTTVNVLSPAKRVAVVRALVEGNSLRATARLVGVSRNTVNALLLDVGAACATFQNEQLTELPCRRLEVDEIWSFVGMKAKQATCQGIGHFGIGDVWTYVAIDAETKLCVSWMVGTREPGSATDFMLDLSRRLVNRVQLTTDDHGVYLQAEDAAFGGEIDYAQIAKVYKAQATPETRYSPAVCTGAKRNAIEGDPDMNLVSTSYVEPSNLTMRMSIRRFTRLTNAFSKKLEQHCAAIALHFAYYNWCRIHQTLRVTPAMATGIATKPREVENLLALLPPVQNTGGRPRRVQN